LFRLCLSSSKVWSTQVFKLRQVCNNCAMDSCDVMSVCEISSWDDWTILELMDRIPLGELLLRLGQASRRFNQLAKKNCQGRRKLLLYIPSANGNRMRFVDQFNGISLQ